jgi:hypothetical protein
MSTPKKPRADAKLKTLPEERQHAVIEHMGAHKLSETRAWLREDGVETSAAALSLFWEWWHLQQQFTQDAATTDTLLEELKRGVPGITEEELDELGQRTFSLLSIRRKDADTFVKVRSARSKAALEMEKLKLRERAEVRLTEGLNLQRQKFQRETVELFLKWYADKAALQIAENQSLTRKDKIESIGQQMFGDLW